MKPYKDLTPRQQFLRKNLARLVVYGSFLAVLFWSISKILEIKREKDAEAARPQVKEIGI